MCKNTKSNEEKLFSLSWTQFLMSFQEPLTPDTPIFKIDKGTQDVFFEYRGQKKVVFQIPESAQNDLLQFKPDRDLFC